MPTRLAGTLMLWRGVVPVVTDERSTEGLERIVLDRNPFWPNQDLPAFIRS